MRETITVARRDLTPGPQGQSVGLVDALRNNSQSLDKKTQSVDKVNHRVTLAMFIEEHDHRPISEMNLRDGFSELSGREYRRAVGISSEVAWRLGRLALIADLRIDSASA